MTTINQTVSGGTTNGDIYPSATGQNLGALGQLWNAFLQVCTFGGSTSGSTQLKASAIASGVLTLPAATDTLVGKATTDTLTNKTLTSPTITGATLTTPDIGVATGTSLALGGGTAITKIVKYTTTLTPSAVGATSSAVQAFTVTGLTTSDFVAVNSVSALGSGLAIGAAWVASADTLNILFVNVTAGSLTPVAGATYRIIAFR